MQPHTRSTEYTTAPAGLLMILNHFDPEFTLSQENEITIWHETALLPTRASSIFALAVFAKNQGLTPRIVVEGLEFDYPDYRFKRYKKSDIELANTSSVHYQKKAKKLAIPVEERDIPFKEILEHIDIGKVLLVRLNEGLFRDVGSTSKYVVLYGKNERGEYLIADPMLDEPLIAVSEELLQQSYETLTSKKKRGHRMIVF